MTEFQQNKYLEALTSALEHERGIKIKFPNHASARRFQRMCHMLRSRLRQRIAKGLPHEQAYKATTEYDVLSISIEPDGDGFALCIAKSTPLDFEPL